MPIYTQCSHRDSNRWLLDCYFIAPPVWVTGVVVFKTTFFQVPFPRTIVVIGFVITPTLRVDEEIFRTIFLRGMKQIGWPRLRHYAYLTIRLSDLVSSRDILKREISVSVDFSLQLKWSQCFKVWRININNEKIGFIFEHFAFFRSIRLTDVIVLFRFSIRKFN